MHLRFCLLGPFGVAVDDEAGVFGYLIVEAAGGFVGFVGVPVDAGGARVFGFVINSFNQGFAYSFSTGCFGGGYLRMDLIAATKFSRARWSGAEKAGSEAI